MTLWPWTFAVYRLWRDKTLCQIWTQSNTPRRVIAMSVFDLMTFSMCYVMLWALGSFSPCLTFDNLSLSLPCDTLFHAVTLTFDPSNLKVHGTSSVTWLKSIRNFSEIEQSPAELLIILQIFAHVMSRCDLDLWPLDLVNFYSTLDVLCLNSLQNLSEIK